MTLLPDPGPGGTGGQAIVNPAAVVALVPAATGNRTCRLLLRGGGTMVVALPMHEVFALLGRETTIKDIGEPTLPGVE